MLLQGCGRMLGVLSLALGVLPGPPSLSGGRHPPGKSSAAPALLVGSPPVPTRGRPLGGRGTHRALPCARHGCRYCSAVAASPSAAPCPLAGQGRASYPWVTGKVGCSQHHLEDKSCWVLHLFVASLVIIRDPKAQTVAFSLAVELPCHLWGSPCPASTVHPQAVEAFLPPRAAPVWPGLSSSGSCPEPSPGAVQVWMGMGQC